MKRYTFLFMLIPFFFGCKSKESVLLRLKYQPNEEDNYSISVKCDCQSAVHFYSSMTIKLTMDSMIDNSVYSMISQVTAVKMDIKVEGGLGQDDMSVHYDSEQPYRDMDAAQREADARYDSIMSKTYGLSFDKRGDLIKASAIGDDKIKAPFNVQILQLPYPDRIIKVGDTWTATVKNPLGNNARRFGMGDYTLNYTVDDIDKFRVKVDVEFAFKTNPNEKGDGSYSINRKTGQVENGHIKVPIPGCNDEALVSIINEAVSSYK